MALKSILTVANKIKSVITVLEVYGAVLEVPLQDTFTVRDNTTKALSKRASDVQSYIDRKAIAYSKPRSDVLNIVDTILVSVNLGKTFSDLTYFSDNITQKVFSKNVKDTSSFVEKLAFNINKSATDTAQILDNILIAIQKFITLSDTSTSNDLARIGYFKNLKDFSTLSDVINIVIDKGVNLADLVSMLESGSIISQGYTVDNTYFSEAYVGDFRTFS